MRECEARKCRQGAVAERLWQPGAEGQHKGEEHPSTSSATQEDHTSSLQFGKIRRLLP